jgi:hypothetical protein
MVDGSAQRHDEPVRSGHKRRKARQDRSTSDNFGDRLRRRSLRDSQLAPADPLWFDSLPDKIKKRQFTREEQVVLAKHLRASVILDAADEAIYKVGRRASRNISPDQELFTPTLSSRRDSMASTASEKPSLEPAADGRAPDSFFDSFRWLDEEDDLDLRLFLDDYHANLREDVALPTDKPRPSFRRHLSISKLPFGRSSLSHSRPATMTRAVTSTPTSPALSPLSPISTNVQHVRRKSRTLSLIGGKLASNESVTAIDPGAAHYQDPEARLKLRVYLASPQKFDEAIEFGFPSVDALGGASAPAKAKNPTAAAPKHVREKSSDLMSSLRTFLADEDDDDKMSLNSDQASAADPESPKTPEAFERPALRPLRLATEPVQPSRPVEAYAQMPASSREMTLRMTLTRPDLRACEDQIYGFQKTAHFVGRRSQSQSSPLRDELMVGPAFLNDSHPKQSIDRVFAGMDHWNANADGGLVKRIWNRVRRV